VEQEEKGDVFLQALAAVALSKIMALRQQALVEIMVALVALARTVRLELGIRPAEQVVLSGLLSEAI
jgi:hypothetical protein